MKNLLKSLLVFSLVFFSSCEKENLTEQSQENISIKGIRYITSNTESSRTSVVNGMLEFEDVASFLATIEHLEQQTESHDDAFLAKWNHLNDDDLEAKEISEGHDIHQPLINFENQFSGFVSLRKAIRSEQENLIKNQTLNDTNEPDNHFVMEDEVRTVLNANAQVKIGQSLYQMTRFGYVEVTDGDFNTLAIVANSDASTLNLQNVEIHGGYYGSSSANNTQNTATDCRTDIDETNYKNLSSNYRVKGIQKLKGYNAIWGTKIKAKTVHQKKRWWGGWTSKRTWITAKIEGESVDRYCEQDNLEDRSRSKRKHKVIAKIKGPSTHVYKTKYQKLKTIHKKNDNSNIIDDFFYE